MTKKDQNKPKRNLTAYMFYSQNRRGSIKSSEPDITFGGITKKIAAEWKKLNDSDKSKFQKMSDKDKQRYLKEMESYVPPVDMEGGKKKKKKKKKDPNAPKKGLSAFMFFSKERRSVVKAKNPNIAFGDVAKKIGAEWKQLKDSKKAKFIKLAKKDKERYVKDMANYKPPIVNKE